MEVSKLRLSDEPRLREWMLIFTAEHIKWWNTFYHRTWTDTQIDRHIDKHNLIHKSIDRLYKTNADDQEFIRVLRHKERLSGIVYANVKTDNFVAFKTGCLQWIWVDPECRGKGYAKVLMKLAEDWLSEKEVCGSQLYVNKRNKAAISLYEKMGYEISDYQMIFPMA